MHEGGNVKDCSKIQSTKGVLLERGFEDWGCLGEEASRLKVD